MKLCSRKSFHLAAHAILSLALASVACGANFTWSGSSDNQWTNTVNWVGGVVAGGTTGTTSTDVAIFNTNPANKAPTLGTANFNLSGITFDTASVGGFTIGTTGGNPLLLSSGGVIQMTGSVAASQIVNAPLILQNAAASASGTYSILNNAASSANTLTIGGSITGSATSGTTTLTYGGSNTGTNTISGSIGNGSGGGKLSLTKDGAGTLVLSGSNNYSGSTTINNGILQVANSNALGSSAVSTIADSSVTALQLAGNITLGNLITLGGKGPASNDGVLQNISGTNTLTNFVLAALAGGTRVAVSNGSTLAITNNITGFAQGVRVIGGGTLQLDGDNTSAFTNMTFGLSGAGGLTLKLGNNAGAGTGLLNLEANTTIQSKDSTALTLANSFKVFTTTSALTFGANSTGNLTISGGVALSSTNLNLTVANAVTTLNGIVSGGSTTGTLTKLGTGTLVLGGSNTYTDATLISSGAVSVSNIVALGGATSAVVLGGTASTGILSYTGTNATFTRGLTIGAGGGELDVTTAGQTLTVGTGGIDKTSGGLLTFSGAGNITVTSVIGSGGGGLTKDGAGTLILSGSNSYSGSTYINNGILQVANSNALGASAVTAITSSTTAALQLSGNITLGNLITLGGKGPGLNNDGVLQSISGSNTLTNFVLASPAGGTRIAVSNGSTLAITNNITGAAQGIRVLGGGTLQLDGDNTAGFSNMTFGLGGSGGLTVKLGNSAGAGVGQLSFDATTTIQSKNSTAYTLGNTLAFLSTGSAATFGAASTGNLVFSGPTTLSANLALTIANAQTTMSGVISGTGALNKLGAGVLVLSGSSSYTGATTVSTGKLLVSGSLAGTTAVSVASGAELNANGAVNTAAAVALSGTLSGTGSVGTVTAASGATVVPGTLGVASTGKLTASTLNLGSGAHLAMEINGTTAGTGYDQVVTTSATGMSLAGDLVLNIGSFTSSPADILFLIVNNSGGAGGTMGSFSGLTLTGGGTADSGTGGEGTLITFNSQQYQLTYLANAGTASFSGGNDVALYAVPEPNTWAMMLAGFGLLLSFQRMRSRKIG